MKLVPTPIEGLFVAECDVFKDDRGAFARLFSAQELAQAIGGRHIVQVNHSQTAKAGTVRGMHYQRPPHAEMKMVRCLKGRVLDVAVDVRAGSPTFLNHHAEILTPENGRMMIIPEGFAHGFQALQDNCDMLYLHTAYYTQGFEGGLRADDPQLDIAWPMPVAGLSPKDLSHALIDDSYQGIRL